MSFIMVCFLLGLPSNKVISDLFMVSSVEGCPGLSSLRLWRISQGEGRLGPMGVDLSVWRRWLMEVLGFGGG